MCNFVCGHHVKSHQENWARSSYAASKNSACPLPVASLCFKADLGSLLSFYQPESDQVSAINQMGFANLQPNNWPLGKSKHNLAST